jgi:lactoylglutathione lyase
MTSHRIAAALVLALALSLIADPVRAGEEEPASEISTDADHGSFTGKVLPVFFVTDVVRSVDFYTAVGFEFHHFFDYSAGEQVQEWLHDEPPIWALMSAGSQTFALHRVAPGADLVVGGMRHYFLMEDVDRHYERVQSLGVESGPLMDRPWMKMFSVVDPDGHLIFFGTEK